MIRNLVFLAREWTLAPAGSALSADRQGHAPAGCNRLECGRVQQNSYTVSETAGANSIST